MIEESEGARVAQGIWAAGFLPRLLKDVYVNRKTGALRLRRGDERHGVHFHTGRIVHSETSLDEQSLTGILAKDNDVMESDLQKAAETARSSGRALPLVLIEQGLADDKQISKAMTEAVRASFQRVTQWNDGLYAFEEQPATPSEGNSAPEVPTGDLILELIRALPGEEAIGSVVEDLDTLLIPSTDPLLRFQQVQLNPAEGYALSRVDGTTSAREILQIIPADSAEAARTIVALICLGLIEGLSGVRRPAETAPIPARPERDETAVSTKKAESPAPQAAAPSSKQKEQQEKERSEISSFFEGLESRNHFELFELSRSATESEIKDAYFKLAKKFHPDAHSDSEFSDLRSKLEAIFVRLGAAYETLRNPKKRANYEAKIGPEKTAAAVSSTAPIPPPPPPPDPAQLLKNARRLYGKEKYWDAIQSLEGLVPLTEGKTRVEALVLLAKAYLKNPHWVKRAEEQLLLAVEANPKHVEAHFLLGTIYHDKNLRARATGRFKKVLEIEPQHEEAAARLQSLEPEAPESQPPEGGLFRKILKKE
jgi:tetratricopeptide (TPR) repeat protein